MSVGNPCIRVRMKPETIRWFKKYATRKQKTMSEILRDYIETLKLKEEALFKAFGDFRKT